MDLLKKFLNNIEEILCAICLSVMTIIAFINVVSRFLLSASLSFTDEITTYLFVLLSLMGSAVAAKRGAHLGLTVLTDLVSPSVRKILKIIGYVFAILFSSSVLYYGIFMVQSQMERGQVTANMQFPEWIFGSFVPIGAFFLTIRFIQVLITEIKSQPENEKEEK